MSKPKPPDSHDREVASVRLNFWVALAVTTGYFTGAALGREGALLVVWPSLAVVWWGIRWLWVSVYRDEFRR